MKTRVFSPWIQLTNRCNLQCEYCYIVDDGRDMSVDVFCGINAQCMAMLDTNAIDTLEYRLAGGEPLLVLETVMEPLSAMLTRFPDHMRAEILTNGTCLSKRHLDFIKSHETQIGLCVSLDSMTYSKPCHGASTAPRVLDALGVLRQEQLGYTLSTVVTDAGAHLPGLAEYIGSHPCPWDVSCDVNGMDGADIETLEQNVYDMIHVLAGHDYPLDTMQFNGIDFREGRTCGAGESLGAFDVDGVLHPCQTLFGQPHAQPNDRTSCRQCPIQAYCRGGCKYQALGRSELLCRINKFYYVAGANYAISLPV